MKLTSLPNNLANLLSRIKLQKRPPTFVITWWLAFWLWTSHALFSCPNLVVNYECRGECGCLARHLDFEQNNAGGDRICRAPHFIDNPFISPYITLPIYCILFYCKNHFLHFFHLSIENNLDFSEFIEVLQLEFDLSIA